MADKKRLLVMTGVYLVVLLYGAGYYTCKLIDKSAVTSFKKLYSSGISNAPDWRYPADTLKFLVRKTASAPAKPDSAKRSNHHNPWLIPSREKYWKNHKWYSDYVT